MQPKTHGPMYELPEELEEQIRLKAKQRELIHEEDVSDLKKQDISKRPYRYVKRIIDVLLSSMALIVLLVPALIVSLAVFVDDPGKVFFRQYRVGRNGKRFRLYKFRTMRSDTPKYLSTMDMDDPDKYITRVGRFLRKTSIDELPQILNILIGDMSIVGPRPLISDELEIHQMREKFGVYQLRPGLTGLAQINGRDTVSPNEKVHWDVTYLQNFGFMMDFKVFLATIPKVFGRAGVVEGYSIIGVKNDEEIGA